MQRSLRLFVYGTLRSEFQHPAHIHISKNFKFIGEARVKGKLFDLGPYPAAIPVFDEQFVMGELFEANNEISFDRAIEALDEYEGYAPADSSKSLFRREMVSVECQSQNFDAWIYWYNQPLTGDWIPSGDILKRDRNGISAQ